MSEPRLSVDRTIDILNTDAEDISIRCTGVIE